MNFLLTPPLAFLIYIPLVLLLVWFGRQLAGRSEGAADAAKRSVYGAGEQAPDYTAAPGYKPFFLVALFFAILHLGMLVLGLSDYSTPVVVYIVGLILGLGVLILG